MIADEVALQRLMKKAVKARENGEEADALEFEAQMFDLLAEQRMELRLYRDAAELEHKAAMKRRAAHDTHFYSAIATRRKGRSRRQTGRRSRSI